MCNCCKPKVSIHFPFGKNGDLRYVYYFDGISNIRKIKDGINQLKMWFPCIVNDESVHILYVENHTKDICLGVFGVVSQEDIEAILKYGYTKDWVITEDNRFDQRCCWRCKKKFDQCICNESNENKYEPMIEPA